jgi:glycosyltransferase involved in cell wall biosynthesis
MVSPSMIEEGRLPMWPKQGGLRVGIELRQATRGASGGIVVVLDGTLHELFKRRPDIDFVVFCTVFNHDMLAADASNVEKITLPLDKFFPELSRLARSYGIDVLFRSYPTVEAVDFPLSRQIFLLPDLQHEYHPDFFDSRSLVARRLAFQGALEGAGAIMTISEFARRTIEERTGSNRDIFVATPSLPPEFVAARPDDTTEAEQARVPEGEFFLFPANLWPHKNHERLFEGFRRFRDRTGSQAELVLTGAPAGWETLRARYGDLAIRHLGYVSPPLLRLLYQRACALTFFSRYEGFGIPLLEAFEAGTPVVCSNTTSLPEVAGDAALMCDPENVEEISRLLGQIAGDAELRGQLAARGRRRSRAFSWVSAAEELAAGIERVRERAESPGFGARPLVSIVTPSYNQGRFIRRTIESVLAQKYPNIEYLVVDADSTDETLDILRSFGDRLRWISEPDSGQAEAINKGLRAVRGQIVGYLNSDDILLPDAIEQVVQHFLDHPECDLVYGDAQYIDDSDRFMGMYRTADYSFDRLMDDCCICQPAAYWRSFVGEVVGAFDEGLQYAMDYDYWIRLDRKGFVIQHMPKTIAQSRLHAGAKTLRARPDIFREIFRVCRDRGGYISRSHVHGYWDHVAHERPSPAGLLRYSASLRATFTALHYFWLNRHRYTLVQSIGASRLAARRQLVRRLQNTPRLFARLLGIRARFLDARLRVGRRGARSTIAPRKGRVRVTGFWPDNWVADRLDVLVDPRDNPRHLRIVGRPVAEMTVRVSANGTQLAAFELRESECEAVTVKLPAGPSELLSFSFSHHAVDGNGRRVAFLVQETNLFREEDLYSLA